jgi:hypothetical protein
MKFKVKFSQILILIILISILSSPSWAFTGIPEDAQVAWIQETNSSVMFTYLEAIVTVKIKNNNNNVQFFKISQQYYQTTPPINWTLAWTSPAAVKMIKNINPGGDYGWEIEPGQTRTVSFKLVAKGPSGAPLSVTPSYIAKTGETPNNFWPLIPEPGLTATWFLPNEIEYLNPTLDLESWNGNFCFWIKNMNSKGPRVEGIVRAPIVPVSSKLTYSNPYRTYISDELPVAQTAAWDVTLYPGQSKHYSYIYQWPSSTSTVTSGSKYKSPSINAESTYQNTTTTVPTPGTGVPYGFLVVGALVAGVGLVYAKFFR